MSLAAPSTYDARTRREPVPAGDARDTCITREAALRARLGIPQDAERVLVFSESSHWDPNWLLTSEEYYARRVRQTLTRAVAELLRAPSRVYTLEALFFLKMHWERTPGARDALRALVSSRQLRLAGCGMTTPDTLIPGSEALLRDYLVGQEWLRRNGLAQEPTVAYFPDSFGHSPELPALLGALGIDKVVVTRIDGMHFPGTDLRPKRDFPLEGSTAHRLLRDERTLDFVWRASDGSEALCHVNAFTYAQGDLLAHAGLTRWMGVPLAVPRRSVVHVAARVASFVRSLAPLARTPYMLCPIGFDFVDPIEGLTELLEAQNRFVYPASGVFVVVAGLDDYLELVDCHRARLPTLSIDPNPCWMGFYGSRGGMKRRVRDAADRLLAVEKEAALASMASIASGAAASSDAATPAIERAWEKLVLTNHHDFVTGTSSDRVAFGEQAHWLDALDGAIAAIPRRKVRALPTSTSTERGTGVRILRRGRVLSVETAHVVVTLDERLGGCMTGFRARGGPELLEGPSDDLVLYRDGGGLWRMGHELRSHDFAMLWRASDRVARLETHPFVGGVEILTHVVCEGQRLTRRYVVEEASPLVRMRIEGSIGRRRALIGRFRTAIRSTEARMDVAGGAVSRPPRKLFAPTFWPCTSWARLGDAATATRAATTAAPALGLFLGGPSCVSFDGEGDLAFVAVRNATRERGRFGVPLLGFPVAGTNDGPCVVDYAVHAGGGAGGDLSDATMARLAEAALAPAQDHVGLAAAPLEITADRAGDAETVRLGACKAASRGDGVIARLVRYGSAPAVVTLRHAHARITRAFVCDARERDLAELAVHDGVAEVCLARSLTTVRLFVDPFETRDARPTRQTRDGGARTR